MSENANIEAGSGGAMAFTFGDPESVLDRSELYRYFELWHNGKWYEPPMPVAKLAQTFNMSTHHRSAIALKVNLLLAHQEASAKLSADSFERFALDFMQMGNAYLEKVENIIGGISRMEYAPSLHLRVGVEDDVYWFVKGGMIAGQHEFEKNSIFHLQQPDVAQEIYGLPEWLSALQAGLLNEEATLFRRRYYKNGAHMGFILYINETLADDEMVEAAKQAMEKSKGAGNFKNMLLNIPGGKKDGVQVLPIGEIAAKDEFSGVKNITRDDMLAAHRTPPPLIGIIPQNSGGFGKGGEALDVFYQIEIVPIIRRMRRVNEWAGQELLSFRNYSCSNGDQITQDGMRIPAAKVA